MSTILNPSRLISILRRGGGGGGGGGGFFLAGEDFWRVFDHSSPACVFVVVFLKWRIARAH